MSTTSGEPTTSRRRRTVVLVILSVVAVVATLGVLAVVLSGDNPTAPTPGGQPTAAPGSPSGSVTQIAPTTSPGTPSSPAPTPFRYQPLWPFANEAEVAVWQQGYRSGGHSPWHLDAEATALAFTTGYLGFTDVSVAVSRSIEGTEAYVSVGYPIENRAPAVAAVLHLAKFGSGADAPWEVVGSRDNTLTLTEPRYGAGVGSPLTVGGQITGVDESIRVQVRQPTSQQPIGESCCLPAGGEDTPWSTTVSFQGAEAPALTIVASTGGHYTEVERFAVTGVRVAR
jgi:hypothetical protein